MAMIRCGYCGKYYDEGYTGTLDNGLSQEAVVAFCDHGNLQRAEKEKAEKEREDQQTQEKKGSNAV